MRPEYLPLADEGDVDEEPGAEVLAQGGEHRALLLVLEPGDYLGGRANHPQQRSTTLNQNQPLHLEYLLTNDYVYDNIAQDSRIKTTVHCTVNRQQ